LINTHAAHTIFLTFVFSCYILSLHLHSFPTRRSSDLAILIDGVDLREIRLSALRDRIGIVSQETLLFDDTVLNNIAYGNDAATEIGRSTRLHSSHVSISYAVFCLKKKKKKK